MGTRLTQKEIEEELKKEAIEKQKKDKFKALNEEKIIKK